MLVTPPLVLALIVVTSGWLKLAANAAELHVRAGRHMATLQANVDGNIATAKARVISLARALIAKLP
jgi:hypothetical protein